MMRFVHAADLHIDSPLRGLARYEGAPAAEMRAATRRAFAGLVDYCSEGGVDLLLLAGDLFDGDWRDYSTGLFFSAQMSRLREAGVRVYLVRGNHDATSRITRNLRLPENVVDFPTDSPGTVRDERLGIAVHGQGFAHGVMDQDLAAGYPTRVAGLFNIGLLHTSLDGRPGHAPYAPTRLEVLADRGYDYWALGHVHAHEVVQRFPFVVYPGCLQGRNARETGPKGAVVVDVEDQRVVELSLVPFDVVRWKRLSVDVSTAGHAEAVRDLVHDALSTEVAQAEGRMLAVRLMLTGGTEAHAQLVRDREHWEEELRATANDVAGGEVWIEEIRFHTRPKVELAALSRRGDVFGQLARALFELHEAEDARRALVPVLAELERKLPREAREGEEGLRFGDPAFLRDFVAEVEATLLPLISGGLSSDPDAAASGRGRP